ncbi:MAG: chloride channel protein [Balneola sp.]
MPYNFTLFWALIIGVMGGFIATGYYWLMTSGLFVVWDVALPFLASLFLDKSGVIIATILLTTFGGLMVGFSTKWMRSPGEISAVVNNIHVEEGRMDYKQNPSMLVNSLISIIFGGSAGPEAPLVQLIVVMEVSSGKS